MGTEIRNATPRPWKFEVLPGNDGLGYIRPEDDDGREIAHHGDSGRSQRENLANAALIVAAVNGYEPMRKEQEMNDPLKPSPALLCKLRSIIVHAEEFLSPTGHIVDREALRSAWDSEVVEWMEQMRALAMLPIKR